MSGREEYLRGLYGPLDIAPDLPTFDDLEEELDGFYNRLSEALQDEELCPLARYWLVYVKTGHYGQGGTGLPPSADAEFHAKRNSP